MQDLLQLYRSFIATEQLFSREHKLLLAVSGGLDSVVLLHLTVSAGYQVEVAHCNFGLRGDESHRDEQFVQRMAGDYGLPFHIRRFDTSGHAERMKMSVQEAARELRYQWFRQLAEEQGFHRILTAHHADDNVETSLMNLFKGTGMAGVRGMLPLSGPIARPLLFAPRQALESYALMHGLAHVEDSSNSSDKYTRNFFRLHIIPLIEQVYPSAMENLRSNMPRWREVEQLYQEAVTRKLNKLKKKVGEEIHIPVELLRMTRPLHTMVFELFHPYGFSTGQLGEIVKLMDSGSGKYISSASHRLLRNRNWLVLSPLGVDDSSVITIEEGMEEVHYPGGVLKLSAYDTRKPIEPDPSLAYLDCSDLQYPLLLRKWKQGDYFYPLGMRKKKKLARFFIDAKLSRTEKEKTWVVESNKRIVWVVGQRIDDRFRILPTSPKGLQIIRVAP